MKQTLRTLIRNVKSIKGNSLAEFATTTALMATLAATAAPKLSEMSEGAKAEKSRNELDKLVKQAGQFYQDTADIEGRGRFPGQDKYDHPVYGWDYNGGATGPQNHDDQILAQIIGDPGSNTAPTFTTYQGADAAQWLSVFGIANEDFPKPTEATLAPDDIAGTCPTCPGTGANEAGEVNASIHTDENGNYIAMSGHEEWLKLFGGEPLGSQYQDGHLVYQVVGGYGSGDDTYPPVLYVADIENASHFNNVLEP